MSDLLRFNTMTKRDAARAYAADLGWYVFRLAPGTPVPMAGSNGHLDATNDPAEVEKLWDEYPDANIGLFVARSGLYAADQDPRHAGPEMHDWPPFREGGLPLPETSVAQSPGSGYHYYFAAGHLNGARFHKTMTKGPGVDVKYNGYTVLAPSTRPDGEYRWVKSAGFAESPAVDALVVKRSIAGSETRERDDGDAGGDPFDWSRALTPGAVPWGEQDETLAKAAASARGQNLGNRMALGLLYRVVECFDNQPDHPRGPWTREHADAKWAWAKERYPPGGEVGEAEREWLEQLNVERPPVEQIAPDSLLAKELVRERARRDAKRILDDEQADEEPLPTWTTAEQRRMRPEMSWLIEGLAPAGGAVGIVFGPQGSGKSFLLLDLLISICNGLDEWMGWPIVRDPGGRARDAGLILGEGVAGIQARVNARLAACPNCTDDGLLTVEYQPVNLASRGYVRRLAESMRAQEVRSAPFRPAVLVMDTQGLLIDDADENSRTEMRRVYSNMKWLATEFSCLVVMVTHPGHEQTQRPAGASSQMQDADFVVQVAPGQMAVRKVREGPSGEVRTFRLASVAGTSSVVPILTSGQDQPAEAPDLATLSADLERTRHAVLAAVRILQLGREKVTSTAVCREVGGNGEACKSIVRALLDEGALVNLGTDRSFDLRLKGSEMPS